LRTSTHLDEFVRYHLEISYINHNQLRNVLVK